MGLQKKPKYIHPKIKGYQKKIAKKYETEHKCKINKNSFEKKNGYLANQYVDTCRLNT